jgi:hypothetical protein
MCGRRTRHGITVLITPLHFGAQHEDVSAGPPARRLHGDLLGARQVCPAHGRTHEIHLRTAKPKLPDSACDRLHGSGKVL